MDIEIENSNGGENVSVQLSAESHHDMQVSMGVSTERKLEVDIVADLRVLPPQCSVVNTTPPLSSKDLSTCSPEFTTEEVDAHKESSVESVTCSGSTAKPKPRNSFTDRDCNTNSMNTDILTSSCSAAATPTSMAGSTALSGDTNAASRTYSATSVDRDPVLSLESQTDNIKEKIDAYAQVMFFLCRQCNYHNPILIAFIYQLIYKYNKYLNIIILYILLIQYFILYNYKICNMLLY